MPEKGELGAVSDIVKRKFLSFSQEQNTRQQFH
jgi:hypothetical protein